MAEPTSEPDNIILHYLRRMDTRLDSMDKRLANLERRMNELADYMQAFMQTVSRHDTALTDLASRVERIEKRLDLTD